jgi:DNA replication protein DnaC
MAESQTTEVTESGQDSVTSQDLSRMLEQRRAEAGIVLAEPEPLSLRLPASPEVVSERTQALRDYEAKAKTRSVNSQMLSIVQAAGDRYRGCRLETFEVTTAYQKRVLAMVTEYGQNLTERRLERQGLVLFGPVGTGKDHLAYSLALTAAMQGMTVKWINGQSWFGRVRDAMDTSESEESIISEIERPDLAVISDPLPPIGDLTQHQATMFYRAIEARYCRGKITITTVNVADDAEADRRMGAATWDRLCHGAWKIHCAWPSYRKPARELSPPKTKLKSGSE